MILIKPLVKGFFFLLVPQPLALTLILTTFLIVALHLILTLTAILADKNNNYIKLYCLFALFIRT